jgi:hypothetical protein
VAGLYPGGVLEGRRTGTWSDHYGLLLDGEPVGSWKRRAFRGGGTLVLEGRTYNVTSNFFGTGYQLLDPNGEGLAVANSVSRKRWMVEAGYREYQFARTSFWRLTFAYLVGDREAGNVSPISGSRRSDYAADLPDVPVPIQGFVLAIVLSLRDIRRSSAAS